MRDDISSIDKFKVTVVGLKRPAELDLNKLITNEENMTTIQVDEIKKKILNLLERNHSTKFTVDKITENLIGKNSGDKNRLGIGTILDQLVQYKLINIDLTPGNVYYSYKKDSVPPSGALEPFMKHKYGKLESVNKSNEVDLQIAILEVLRRETYKDCPGVGNRWLSFDGVKKNLFNNFDYKSVDGKELIENQLINLSNYGLVYCDGDSITTYKYNDYLENKILEFFKLGSVSYEQVSPKLYSFCNINCDISSEIVKFLINELIDEGVLVQIRDIIYHNSQSGGSSYSNAIKSSPFSEMVTEDIVDREIVKSIQSTINNAFEDEKDTKQRIKDDIIEFLLLDENVGKWFGYLDLHKQLCNKKGKLFCYLVDFNPALYDLVDKGIVKRYNNRYRIWKEDLNKGIDNLFQEKPETQPCLVKHHCKVCGSETGCMHPRDKQVKSLRCLFCCGTGCQFCNGGG